MNKLDLKTIIMVITGLIGIGILVGQFYVIRDSSVSENQLDMRIAQQDLRIEREFGKFRREVNGKLDRILRQTK